MKENTSSHRGLGLINRTLKDSNLDKVYCFNSDFAELKQSLREWAVIQKQCTASWTADTGVKQSDSVGNNVSADSLTPINPFGARCLRVHAA